MNDSKMIDGINWMTEGANVVCNLLVAPLSPDLLMYWPTALLIYCFLMHWSTDLLIYLPTVLICRHTDLATYCPTDLLIQTSTCCRTALLSYSSVFTQWSTGLITAPLYHVLLYWSKKFPYLLFSDPLICLIFRWDGVWSPELMSPHLLIYCPADLRAYGTLISW